MASTRPHRRVNTIITKPNLPQAYLPLLLQDLHLVPGKSVLMLAKPMNSALAQMLDLEVSSKAVLPHQLLAMEVSLVNKRRQAIHREATNKHPRQSSRVPLLCMDIRTPQL
jgi:ABC-type uncharacterized transport system YnjBCD permease subunit